MNKIIIFLVISFIFLAGNRKALASSVEMLTFVEKAYEKTLWIDLNPKGSKSFCVSMRKSGHIDVYLFQRGVHQPVYMAGDNLGMFKSQLLSEMQKLPTKSRGLATKELLKSDKRFPRLVSIFERGASLFGMKFDGSRVLIAIDDKNFHHLLVYRAIGGKRDYAVGIDKDPKRVTVSSNFYKESKFPSAAWTLLHEQQIDLNKIQKLYIGGRGIVFQDSMMVEKNRLVYIDGYSQNRLHFSDRRQRLSYSALPWLQLPPPETLFAFSLNLVSSVNNEDQSDYYRDPLTRLSFFKE